MFVIKRRLLFIEEFNDKGVDFLKVELIAVQLRKIIEAVAYGCVSACELGGDKLSDAAIDAYSAQNVFSELEKLDLGFVPRPCSFAVKGAEKIEEWSISNRKLPQSQVFKTANDYTRTYKKLHQYAHEFHPRRTHHLLHKDGLTRAIAFLRPVKKKLTNSLWQHFIPFGNRALVVDFGERDTKLPEVFVFSQKDNRAAWPILFLLTEPIDEASRQTRKPAREAKGQCP